MLTYGRLHVDHEMIVLQACGMSPTRIVFITLMISAIVMLLTSLVALWVKPVGERQVQVLLQGQKNLTNSIPWYLVISISWFRSACDLRGS